MEQSIGETSAHLATAPIADATTFEQKSENVSMSQTDFSVARRLLSVDVGYQTATLDGKAEVKVPESPAVGWQFILPTDHSSSLVYKHRVFPGPLPSDGFPQFSAPYLSPVPSSLRPAAYTVYHGHTAVGSEEPSPVELGSPEHLPNDNMPSEAADPSKLSDPVETQSQNEVEEEESESDDDGSDGGSSTHSQSSCGGSLATDEPKKPKRTRTAYSNYQLDQLELIFSQTQYPDVFLREELANRLGIKEDRIQVWFQNRRARYRKQERTGSVSLRSRYRQRRLQKAIQDSRNVAPLYPGYVATTHTSALMLPSAQPVSPYIPTFPLPITPPTTSDSSLQASGQSLTTAGSYFPAFPALKPPLYTPYHPRSANGSTLSPYSAVYSNMGNPDGHQKV